MTASTVVVIHMRWRHWGSRKPIASGTFAGNMGVRVPVRVKLSRRLSCAGGERHYRRVTVTERRKRKPFFVLPLDARCPSG